MGFDLFIAAILLITTIRGAAKGVAWQLAGIGALVLCFLFATPLSLTVAPMIKLAPPLNRWVAMLGIYLIFSFGTFAVARGFREALEKAKFVEFDRHLGALFGLLKGAVLALVITFFSVAMSPKAREYILTTHTGYISAHIMNAIDPVMPKELHAILEPYIHTLDAADPDLQRSREDFHRELDAEAETEPTVKPRSGKSGYRPIASDDEERSVRDPFQEESNDPNAPPTTPTLMDEAEEFLKLVPNLASKVGPSVKKQIQRALENTLEEHRDEFLEQLGKANTSAAASTVANAWQNGRPRQTPTSNPPTEKDGALDLFGILPNSKKPANKPVERRPFIDEEESVSDNSKAHRQELLTGIARLFSRQAADQARKMTEIETNLLGLPDSVAIGALEDWLSDLHGEDPDPDEQTDAATPLNARIANQVELQRIPRERLPDEWQTRLEKLFR